MHPFRELGAGDSRVVGEDPGQGQLSVYNTFRIGHKDAISPADLGGLGLDPGVLALVPGQAETPAVPGLDEGSGLRIPGADFLGELAVLRREVGVGVGECAPFADVVHLAVSKGGGHGAVERGVEGLLQGGGTADARQVRTLDKDQSTTLFPCLWVSVPIPFWNGLPPGARTMGDEFLEQLLLLGALAVELGAHTLDGLAAPAGVLRSEECLRGFLDPLARAGRRPDPHDQHLVARVGGGDALQQLGPRLLRQRLGLLDLAIELRTIAVDELDRGGLHQLVKLGLALLFAQGVRVAGVGALGRRTDLILPVAQQAQEIVDPVADGFGGRRGCIFLRHITAVILRVHDGRLTRGLRAVGQVNEPPLGIAVTEQLLLKGACRLDRVRDHLPLRPVGHEPAGQPDILAEIIDPLVAGAAHLIRDRGQTLGWIVHEGGHHIGGLLKRVEVQPFQGVELTECGGRAGPPILVHHVIDERVQYLGVGFEVASLRILGLQKFPVSVLHEESHGLVPQILRRGLQFLIRVFRGEHFNPARFQR